MFFAFFYTATVFNPVDTADNLRSTAALCPAFARASGRRNTSTKFSLALRCSGALYLALICLLPELLISYASLPFYFGGTSLLIVVNVTMDTVAQIHGHLQAHQYEGLISKAKLRGRKR